MQPGMQDIQIVPLLQEASWKLHAVSRFEQHVCAKNCPFERWVRRDLATPETINAKAYPPMLYFGFALTQLRHSSR